MVNSLQIAVACLAVSSAAVSAEESWKPVYPAQATRVMGGGGAKSYSYKYPGSAKSASVDLGTAFASSHWSS